MKKLLFLSTILFAIITFAQENDPVADSKKLTELATILTKNTTNPAKLDSVLDVSQKLYKNSGNLIVRNTAKDLISIAREFRNLNYTTKKITKPFDTFPKEEQKKFSYEYDKFKKVGFINVKNKWTVYNIMPYLAVKEGNLIMRLLTSYVGSEWLFFENVHFIIDGKDYQYSALSSKRDVLNSSVSESLDTPVDENMLAVLEAIANSKEQIEFRLTGQKYKDYKLSSKEKESIILILDLYSKMTE